MIRSAASKVMWVGRATVFLVGLAVIPALLFGVALAGPAQATTFPVTNTSSSGEGSLHDAITKANTTVGADTITFLPGMTGTISLGDSELVMRDDLAINGPGAKLLSVSGGGKSRVFYVAQGVTAQISGLTITGGHVQGTRGTDSFFSGGGGAGGSAGGGGILNDGVLTLQGVVVSGNRAQGGAGGNGGSGSSGSTTGGLGGLGGSADGGGILNKGALTLQDSTVSGNTAQGGAGGNGGKGGDSSFGSGGTGGRGGNGGNARGGSVYNDGVRLTVTNSTLDGNIAQGGAGGTGGQGGSGGFSTGHGGNGGDGGNGSGGATYRLSGNVGFTNATVSNNNASLGPGGSGGPSGSWPAPTVAGRRGLDGLGQGGGLYGDGNLGNTILALNRASNSNPDVFGTFTSQGNNLIQNPSGGSGFVASDKQNVDPELAAALADNGGQTMTRALQPTSPAINAANTALAPTKDQRGVVRPQGAAADIGAFEVDVAPFVVRAGPTGSRVSPTANVTVTFSEPMTRSTINSTTLVLKRGATTIRARVSLDSTGKNAVLNPTASLKAGVTYTATVTTGAKDLWGTALDQNPTTAGNQPKSWRFKIRG